MRFFKKHWPTGLFGIVFSAILYSMMMSQQLTNTFDGLWHQNYRHAGIPELTSGRWMLYFVDKFNMGLHADPIISLGALCLFVLGFLLVVDLFGVENKTAAFLSVALFVSSTAVSNTLSYRMTSLGYGLAYFFAAFGIYAAVRVENRILAALVSGVSVGLSMACYQAYLGVFGIIAVFYLIARCNAPAKEKADTKRTLFNDILRMACSLAVGAVFYVATLSFFLKLWKVSLSTYNGVGGITLSDLVLGLPKNICKTYRYFGSYFLTDALKINRLQQLGGMYVLLALILVVVIVIGARVWKSGKVQVAVLALSALAIPVACNAYMLLAGDKLELQMTAGLAMVMPLTMIVALSCFDKYRVIRLACVVFGVALLYGNAMQVWFDQEAMYEGRNACETMVTQVLEDLKDNDLLSPEYEYFFVGVPARNPYFAVSDIYACANGYAQMGNFWVSGSCCQMSYHGLINKWMGFNLPMSYLFYEDLPQSANITEIPVYPYDGYITVVDDNLVIIKISEHMKYSEYSLY